MNINRFKTDQFAGIIDRDIAFQDGMNVILGNNEAGKSTIIAGIYSTLFQPAEAKKSSGEYTQFEEIYKPAGKDIDEGLYTDGTVDLTVNGEKIRVEKNWFCNPDTKVRISGTGYKSKGAEKKLAELLKFGPTFYSNIVFGRQNNEEAVLEWLFDKEKIDGKSDIKKKIAELSSAIGGIDINTLQTIIVERKTGLGSRWDFNLNAPSKDKGKIKDINDPWSKNVGEILYSYYAWKKILKMLEHNMDTVSKIQELDKQLTRIENQIIKTSSDLDYIINNKAYIQNKETNQDMLGKVVTDIKTMTEVKMEWPLKLKELDEVKELIRFDIENNARKQSEILKKKIEEIEDLKNQLAKMPEINVDIATLSDDYNTADSALNTLNIAKAKLSSGKMIARIKSYNGSEISVSGADSEQQICDGVVELNGFVKINIPEVTEVTVEIEGRDIASIQCEIKELEGKIKDILDRYSVKDIPELKQYKDSIEKTQHTRDEKNTELKLKEDEESLETLHIKLNELYIDFSIEIPEDLEDRIAEIKRKKNETSLDAIKATLVQIISSYKKNYESLSELDKKINEKENEKKKYDDRLSKFIDIESGVDFEERERGLKKEISNLSEDSKKYIQKKASLEAEIGDVDSDEIQEQADAAKVEFEKKLELYRMYSLIESDLLAVKNALKGGDVNLFQEKLAEYLKIISDDKISINDIDENLGIELQSGNNYLLSYKILSEGTKKTILLAFKLAVLEFFFQEEGGVIVLDDVMLDMDPGRRINSAKLLKSFSEKNQVIFTTCDPIIADMLGGNRIIIKNQ